MTCINSIFKNNDALYFRKQQEQEGNARPSLEASHLLLAINSDYSTLAYATLVQLGSTRHDLLVQPIHLYLLSSSRPALPPIYFSIPPIPGPPSILATSSGWTLAALTLLAAIGLTLWLMAPRLVDADWAGWTCCCMGCAWLAGWPAGCVK